MNRVIIKKYYEEPAEKYNIISVCVFRMEKNYKPTTKYYDGLKNLVNIVPELFPDFYLRIYFDASIIETKHKNAEINKEVATMWKPFIEKIKNLKHVQLAQYTHPDFLIDKIYHEGLFGTLVRFIPLFDYKSNNTDLVIVTDIDLETKHINRIRKIYKLFIESESEFHFITRSCYLTLPRIMDVEEKLDKKYVPDILERIIAYIIISRMKFPQYLLENFVNCMKNIDTQECKYIKTLPATMDPKYNKKKQHIATYSNFIFGIDEFFLNTTFLKYVLDEKIVFSYTIFTDITLPFYNNFMKNDDYNKPNDAIVNVYKKALGKYYDNSKSLKKNYEYFDSIVYQIKRSSPEETKKVYEYLVDNLKKISNEEYKKFGFKKSEINCIYNTSYYHIWFKMHEYK